MKKFIAIYYLLVISAILLSAWILKDYVTVNLLSVIPSLLIVALVVDVTTIKKKFDFKSRLYLMKYSRKAKDPTDTNGELSYDKEEFEQLYEGKNESEKKLVRFSRISEALTIPLLLIPFFFFGPEVKIIVSIGITYTMLIPTLIYIRIMYRGMRKTELEREKELEKELEEQKKREELGKWK